MQTDPVFIGFSLLVLVLSIIVHEVAHGYAAYALGDPTAKLAGRLTLNPLRHIDPVGSLLIPFYLVLSHSSILFGWAKPVPYNPYNLKNQRWGEAIVGAAGVATNLFLAVVFGLATRFLVGSGFTTLADAAATISFVNLFLGLFNLIPIPPIDGYTVLRGILPYRLAQPLRDFEDKLRSAGMVTLFVVLVLFSFFLAAPFAAFVDHLFSLLVGI